jgi:histidinol-phosphate aminotransferase
MTVHPGTANFLLVHHSDGAALTERLLAASIAVRPCHSFPGLSAEHLRLTVRDPAAHARLAAAL